MQRFYSGKDRGMNRDRAFKIAMEGVGWHEHPHFNGQNHQPVWVQTWVGGDTTSEPPLDAPISCAVCGKSKEVTYL